MATSNPLLPGTAGQTYTPYLTNQGGALYDDINTLNNSGLTLENGMTAGYGNSGETSNPPLPAKQNGQGINPYGGMQNYPISRVGFMRSIQGQLQKQYTLYFIYNPGEVDVSFSISSSALPANYLFPPSSTYDSTGAPITNGQNVHWQLLFDRTYDMVYDSDPNGNRGVLKDVGALYLLLGTFESNAAVPMSTLVEVIFGQTDNGDIWGFTGYINAVSITYPIFRHNMIPSRALVDLNMTTTYASPGAPPGGTPTSTSTTLPLDTGTGTNTNGAPGSLPNLPISLP